MKFTINLESLTDLKKRKKNIYLIHIPKTSGRGLHSENLIKQGHRFNRKNYRTPNNKRGCHIWKTDFFRLHEYDIKPNLIITVIRNPFDLLCSYYFHGNTYDSEKDNYSHSGWASVNYTHKFKTFKEFIESYCDEKFEWHIPLLKKFLFAQILDDKNYIVSDLILKYEYLDNALKILKDKYNIIINRESNCKKFISKNKEKNYKLYYDDYLKNLVEQKCKKELQVFKYNFENDLDENPIIITNNIKIKI